MFFNRLNGKSQVHGVKCLVKLPRKRNFLAVQGECGKIIDVVRRIMFVKCLSGNVS